MKARHELAGILNQWLELTKAEAVALQSAAWPAARQIQARKSSLKQALADATQRCTQEEGPGAPFPFRTELGRIISLVTRNREILTARLRQARVRQEVLDQAKRNLNKIQRSYVRPQPKTAWQSYS